MSVLLKKKDREDVWIWLLEPKLNMKMTIIDGLDHYTKEQKHQFIDGLSTRPMLEVQGGRYVRQLRCSTSKYKPNCESILEHNKAKKRNKFLESKNGQDLIPKVVVDYLDNTMRIMQLQEWKYNEVIDIPDNIVKQLIEYNASLSNETKNEIEMSSKSISKKRDNIQRHTQRYAIMLLCSIFKIFLGVTINVDRKLEKKVKGYNKFIINLTLDP